MSEKKYLMYKLDRSKQKMCTRQEYNVRTKHIKKKHSGLGKSTKSVQTRTQSIYKNNQQDIIAEKSRVQRVQRTRKPSTEYN